MNRLICLSIAIAAMLCGCATHPTRVVYASLDAVKRAELAAMESYYDLWHRGKVSADSEAKVEELHGQFTVVFQHAVKVARQDWRGESVPDAVATAALAVIEAVESIKGTP